MALKNLMMADNGGGKASVKKNVQVEKPTVKQNNTVNKVEKATPNANTNTSNLAGVNYTNSSLGKPITNKQAKTFVPEVSTNRVTPQKSNEEVRAQYQETAKKFNSDQQKIRTEKTEAAIKKKKSDLENKYQYNLDTVGYNDNGNFTLHDYTTDFNNKTIERNNLQNQIKTLMDEKSKVDKNDYNAITQYNIQIGNLNKELIERNKELNELEDRIGYQDIYLADLSMDKAKKENNREVIDKLYNAYESYDDSFMERRGKNLEKITTDMFGAVASTIDIARDIGGEFLADSFERGARNYLESGEITNEQFSDMMARANELREFEAQDPNTLGGQIRQASNQMAYEIANGVDGIGAFIGQGLDSTANFLAQFALLGPSGSLGMMSAQSATQKYFENLDKGYDKTTALSNGLLTGFISYLTERIGMDNFVATLSGTAGKGIAAQALNAIAGGKSNMGFVADSIISQGMSEGLEELVEGNLDYALDRITASMANGEPVEYNAGDIFYSTLVGGFSGGLMGLAGGAIGQYNIIVNTREQYNNLRNDLAAYTEIRNEALAKGEDVSYMDATIALGNEALNNFENKSTTMGVSLPSDQVNNTLTSEEANSLLVEAMRPDIETAVDQNLKLESLEENINRTAQDFLLAKGINMDAREYMAIPEQNRAAFIENANKISEAFPNVNISYSTSLGDNAMVIKMDGETPTIVVNPNGETSVVVSAIHEVVHTLENTEGYNDLFNEVFKDQKSFIDKVNELSGGRYKGDSLSTLGKEALTITLTEDLMGDEGAQEFVDHMAKYNTSTAYKLFYSLKNASGLFNNNQLNRITSLLTEALDKQDVAYTPSGIAYSRGDTRKQIDYQLANPREIDSNPRLAQSQIPIKKNAFEQFEWEKAVFGKDAHAMATVRRGDINFTQYDENDPSTYIYEEDNHSYGVDKNTGEKKLVKDTIPKEIVRNLDILYKHPFAVISGTQPGTYLLLTKATTSKGAIIVLPLDPKKYGNYYDVDLKLHSREPLYSVRSVYGKNNPDRNGVRNQGIIHILNNPNVTLYWAENGKKKADVINDVASLLLASNGHSSVDPSIAPYFEEVNRIDHKEKQLEIIEESNPMNDDIHTGIRNIEDIQTFEEATSDPDELFTTPDYTEEDIKKALNNGYITVYSSYPIENGVFVTPSRMEAQNYAGENAVYEKTVSLQDVAWIDSLEGQYTEINKDFEIDEDADNITKQENEENTIENQIHNSMSMQDAKRMLDRAWKIGLEKWYEDYNNVDEFINGEGREEAINQLSLVIDNNYGLQDDYINSNEDILNEVYSIDDVIEAYLDGNLKNANGRKVISDIEFKEGQVPKETFYSQKDVSNPQELWAKASERVTKNNENDVLKARADAVILFHNPDATAELGLSQAEVNKKIRQWARYSVNARNTSNKLNEGVPREYQWVGLENSNLLSRYNLSDKQIEEMVGNFSDLSGNGYGIKDLGAAMLSFDGSINYKALDVIIEDYAGASRMSNELNAAGTYNKTYTSINIGRAGQGTIEHEMGHFIDNLWGREISNYLLGEGKTVNEYLSHMRNREVLQNIENEDVKAFVDNFFAFMDNLKSKSDIRSEYAQKDTEIFARFADYFTSWVQKTAGGWNDIRSFYEDNFTTQDCYDFVKLLQQKNMLNATVLTEQQTSTKEKLKNRIAQDEYDSNVQSEILSNYLDFKEEAKMYGLDKYDAQYEEWANDFVGKYGQELFDDLESINSRHADMVNGGYGDIDYELQDNDEQNLITSDSESSNDVVPPNGPTRVQGEVLDGYGEERTQRFASSNIPKSQIFNEQQQEQVREEIADGKFTYLGLSNKVEVQRAKEWMQRDGVDETFNKFMSNNTPNAKSVVQGEVLLQELAKNKDPRWHDVAVKMADDATVAGQFLQAYSIMQRLSPEGQLMAIRRNLNRMQNDMDNKYGNKAPQLTLNEELMDELRNATDPKEAENIRERIYNDLNEQVPRTFMDLMDSWRYLAMLGNPRTHIRNIIGNGAFVPAVEIKNAIGTVLENSVGRLMNLDYKTKSVLNPFSEADNKLIELGKQQYEEYKGAIEKGQKYEQRGFSEERKLGRLLNKLSNLNSTALDKEDYFFSKDRYARSFAQFMKANNITAENLTPEMQAKANDYAMLEAQRATYRDANSVAEWLNKLEYGNEVSKGISLAKKAVIPFTKTPMNIIKRGVRYSPISLLTSIPKAVYELNKGNITANEFLDVLASGMTGSAIALLGAWLTSMGLFRTKDDDKDRKKYFDSENGEQDYAIDLSPFGINGTYTLDWASPVIMPFAVGAEFYNALKDTESFTDALNMVGDISAKVMDPIIETSMLSSLKETLQSYSMEGGRWFGDMAEAVIQSYILQFMPTLGGQIARTIDGVRRTTSPNKGGIDKLMKKIYNKIPWVSQLNEPYINKQGQEERTEDLGMGWVGRAFLNMVSPGYYSSKDIDKYDEEMYRLYETMGNLEVFPSSTTKSVTFDKENFKFTDKEYTEWHKTRYQTETEYVNAFMDSKAYQNLSDYERVATIADIRSYAQKVAKKEFLESKGYIYTDDKELADSDSKYVYDKQLVNTQGALDNGIELHSYYDYLNNAGSKQAEKIAYLENTDLSKKQKEYLYNLSGYKASYSDAYAKAMKNTTNSSSKSKKSSSGSKKSSSASISIDKVSGGGSGKTLNMKAPLTKEEKVSNDNKLSDAYFNAYSRSMKNVSQASGQTIVCPNCHNQVVPYNGRCPICGNPL